MTATNAERLLSQLKADAAYVTSSDLILYLCGFTVEDGFLIVDKNEVALYTDKRYLESAENFFKDKNGFAAYEITTDNRATKLLQKYGSVGVPFDRITYKEFEKLQAFDIKLVDSMPAFEACMMIKTDEELSLIQKACNIAETAFLKLLPQIKEGVSETEIAARLEYEMRMLGAEKTSFDTIVAFGKNAAVPHHQTGNDKLCFGDEILIDFGCKVGGYCSDMTRTFLFGDDKKREKFKKIYQEVLTAHELVFEKFCSGMTGKQGDSIAREYLKSKGLDEYFTHSLGHGVGLNIHEEPRLSRLSNTVFCDNMVFSNEPGVYLKGELGVRIEDTVYLQDGKLQSMMTSKKELIIL